MWGYTWCMFNVREVRDCTPQPVLSVLGIAAIIFWLDDNLLDELSHVLTQCFTAGPLALSVAVERVGAGMLLVTVKRDFHEIKH